VRKFACLARHEPNLSVSRGLGRKCTGRRPNVIALYYAGFRRRVYALSVEALGVGGSLEKRTTERDWLLSFWMPSGTRSPAAALKSAANVIGERLSRLAAAADVSCENSSMIGSPSFCERDPRQQIRESHAARR